jgi:hypothetical protein
MKAHNTSALSNSHELQQEMFRQHKLESSLYDLNRQKRRETMKSIALAAAILLMMAILVLFPGVGYGQTAKVIPLKPEDTKELQATYNALQEAQKKWDAAQKKVQKEYTTVKPDDPDAGNTIVSGTFSSDDCDTLNIGSTEHIQIEGVYLNGNCTKNGKPVEQHVVEGITFRKGWENGIEFDKDFKYIVPARPVTKSGSQIWDGGSSFIVPAFGDASPGVIITPNSWGEPEPNPGNCGSVTSTNCGILLFNQRVPYIYSQPVIPEHACAGDWSVCGEPGWTAAPTPMVCTTPTVGGVCRPAYSITN